MAEAARDVVLVADDDPTCLEWVVGVLEDAYRVVPAKDGPGALAAMEAEPVDLVVLDVNMPGPDGLEICRRIKAAPDAPFLPVILLTGLKDQRDRNAGLSSGADDFVTKPVDAAELRLRIRSLLAIRERDRDIRSQRGALEARVAERTRELERQTRFNEEIIDSLPVSLYVVDRDLRIVAWNRQREMGRIGLSRRAALGRSVREVFPSASSDALQVEFREIFDGGIPRVAERESSVDGDLRTFRVQKVPMRMESGEVTHVLSIGEDVTEQRRMERAMVLAEKIAAVGRLAAGVAHEINTPLATIATCSRALLDRIADGGSLDGAAAEFEEYLSLVEEEAFRAKRITEGLLDFSRAPARCKEPSDLAALVDRTIQILKHHSGFRDVELVRDLPADLPPVNVDRDAVVQVLVALTVNALDAMPQGGRLTLAARRDGDEVRCDVTDTGSGIAPEDMPRIFEPFFTTKPPGRGTGLGLAVCDGIVRSHGGRIEVDSRPGSGTRFTVVVPAASAEAKELAS